MSPKISSALQTFRHLAMANHEEAASRMGAYPVTVGVTGSGAASMVSAASLLASRRHRTASRSPAPTRNAANTSTEQLLMEQNRLLLEQLKILQLQQQQQPSASSAGKDSLFCESNQVLQGIDPDLKQVFQNFEQETKHLLSAWHTQKSILEKYQRWIHESKMHPHFQAEARQQWQWTKIYAAVAVPLDHEDTMSENPYDIAEAWNQMRARHAQECFDFVSCHQERCVQHYEALVRQSSLQQKLLDKVISWFAANDIQDVAMQRTMQRKADAFVESILRAEMPKLRSRMEKEKEKVEKRDKEVTEAMTKWSMMEVKDVLSPAMLELARLGHAKKPLAVQEDSALAFLIKDNEDLQKKYKLKIAKAGAEGKPVPKPSKPQRKPTPAPKTNRHRSTSRKSASSSRASSRKSREGKGCKKQVTFESPGKGGKKGKGKGKGKSKSKGK